MTKEQKQAFIAKVAKSHNQRYALEKLLDGQTVQFNTHYCNSTRYYNSYKQSWLSMIQRLRAEGFNVNFKKGKQGGYWTSTILLA